MNKQRVTIIRLCSCLLICAAVFSGCSISQRVIPAPAGTNIDTLYIENNSAVLMSGLVEEIQRQVRSMGYDTKIYSGERPKEAIYCLKYTANWKWDMAMYLTFFHATLLEEDRVLGTAEYDARSGGANVGKFGHTAEQLRPILTQLLVNVRPTKAAVATAVGTIHE